MSTAPFRAPTTAFVVGLVAWNAKVAATGVLSAMLTLRATVVLGLMMVANAVTGLPTVAERLLGRTAATSPRSETSGWMVPESPTSGLVLARNGKSTRV